MKYIRLGCLFLLPLFFGCSTNMETFEEGNPENPRKVLIASEDTKFKRMVVEELIELLGTESWYFMITGLDDLPDTEIEDFGAVLVIFKLSGGRVESRANDFLEANSKNPKLILFLTTAIKGPIPEQAQEDMRDVDAVTSASKADLAENSAEELAGLLRERVQ